MKSIGLWPSARRCGLRWWNVKKLRTERMKQHQNACSRWTRET